jgi:type VI secretion system secreted protein VgrG
MPDYTNSFEAVPSSLVFRPQRTTPRPVIHGLQTATVVGKAGEEIWTDKYGRVIVQFHWDQLGKNDEKSSCWIRVAQGWAGKQWGALFIPRVGQEVIISFLEGNPDRPLITGCVYNAAQTVPYTLPSEQTKSTLRSNSSKGGAGYNEIRFEDKKDSEELYVHAEKDMNVLVLNDETLTVDKGNRKIQVNAGNETHDVKGTRGVTVSGNETHTNQKDYSQTVTGNFSLKVSGNLTIDVTGSISVKAGTSLTNQAGTSLENKAGTSLENKAGTTMTNDAGVSLTNKASASQTVDGGGLLTVKGGLVKIN